MSHFAGLGDLGGMDHLLRFVRLLPLAAVAAVPVIASAACNAQVATVLSSNDSGVDSGGGGGGGAACTGDPQCNDNPTISSLRGKCTDGVCVCNPGVLTTPSGKCGDVSADASTNTDDCVAKGGVCISNDLPAPPTHRPAGPGEGTCAVGVCWVPTGTPPVPVCFNDGQCAGSPLAVPQGQCFFGVCVCVGNFTVQPNGKCNTPPPPDCATQKGTCRQQPAECLADELASAQETEMSCGDLIEATCCNKKAVCKGPAREVAGSGYVPVEFTCCAPNDAIHAPICVNGYQTCPKGDTPVAKPGTCPGG
jgi:hypothetical protein